MENELDEYMLGSIYYRDGDYEDAIEQFTKVLVKSPSDYRAELLSGISHLALRNYDQAERYLKPLVNDQSHLFQDQARWFLGLTYLTDEDESNDGLAAILFEKIEDKSLKAKIKKLR